MAEKRKLLVSCQEHWAGRMRASRMELWAAGGKTVGIFWGELGNTGKGEP
jgi:hypothetical protein